MNINKNPQLIIMAAGLGSRYGGLKQMESITPEGEIILDFAVFDAIKAGFKDIIFIIKDEMAETFANRIIKRIKPFANVSYVIQENPLAPRTKPYGTCHAVMAAKDKISGPFCVINSDDYYGPKAFLDMYDFLCNDTEPDTYAMAGYLLKNTLSETGAVTRGVCKESKGFLTEIVETKGITKDNTYPSDTLVSMNFWGFKPSILEYINQGWDEFLTNAGKKNEYLLPIEVGKYLQNNLIKVKVLPTTDKWVGVTYKEDKEVVTKKFEEYKAKGLYPGRLWEC